MFLKLAFLIQYQTIKLMLFCVCMGWTLLSILWNDIDFYWRLSKNGLEFIGLSFISFILENYWSIWSITPKILVISYCNAVLLVSNLELVRWVYVVELVKYIVVEICPLVMVLIILILWRSGDLVGWWIVVSLYNSISVHK